MGVHCVYAFIGGVDACYSTDVNIGEQLPGAEFFSSSVSTLGNQLEWSGWAAGSKYFCRALSLALTNLFQMVC